MDVLDASVWIGILIGTADPRQTELTHVTVPPPFDTEVLSAIRRLNQSGTLSDDGAETAVHHHLRMPFHRTTATAEDLQRAWSLRHRLSFADAWYAAVAERTAGRWVTSDLRAARTAESLGIRTLTVPQGGNGERNPLSGRHAPGSAP